VEASPPGWPRPTRPRLGAALAYRLQPLLRPNRVYRRLAARLRAGSGPARWFTAGERATKEALFGCRMCGQCALPVTSYACPMTCPKELRNGPCGESSGHATDLSLLQRPIDHRLWGSSAWLSYWQGHDDHLFASAGSHWAAPSVRPGAR
jgi:Methylene-tetrahydrofolate reductase C terminal